MGYCSPIYRDMAACLKQEVRNIYMHMCKNNDYPLYKCTVFLYLCNKVRGVLESPRLSVVFD